PSSVAVRDALKRMSSILDRAQPEGPKRARVTEADLPEPRPSPAGTIVIEEYPHKNAQQPSPIMLSWPASRDLDAGEVLLADLFFSAIAGDPTTNLYKLFIDSKT